MLELFKLNPESFGLDISDLSLKIMKMKKINSGFSVESFGEEKIKPGVIVGGEVHKEDELAETIVAAIKNIGGKKLKTKHVVVSLPEEKAFFQIIQMPKIQKEDLRAAVIYEAENYIPLPVEDTYLDFQIVKPIKDGLDHLDVLLVAIPKQTVNPYASALKLADLEPTALEIETLAISRALIENGVSETPVLIIDFGATRTGLAIFSGTSISFTSSITVSSSNFTEIISKNLSLSMTEAENLKVKYGLEEKIKVKVGKKKSEVVRDRGKIFTSLIPVLVDLIQQIKKHLYYYETHSSHEHLLMHSKGVAKILLCGGGSNLKGLPDFLSSELKIPVELANPWVNILKKGEKIPSEISFKKSLEYTTAIGLSLRNAFKTKND